MESSCKPVWTRNLPQMFSFAERTVSYQHQAGLVGCFPVFQPEGEGALVRRGQRLHDHLDHAGALVKVHLVFLQNKDDNFRSVDSAQKRKTIVYEGEFPLLLTDLPLRDELFIEHVIDFPIS